MVVIRLAFPVGRYHATPWGRHVNEGAVEWPPSPWRLLRALVATWRRKSPEIREDGVRRLISALSETPPRYEIPTAVAAHTRHYMPLEKAGKTTKVIDAFLHLSEPAEIFLDWQVELESEDRDLLRDLLRQLTYLGRAESWVEADLAESPADGGSTFAVIPVAELIETGTGPVDHVQLLAPMPEKEHRAWRERIVEDRKREALMVKREKAAEKGRDPERTRLTAADERKAADGLPVDTFEALHQETTDLRKAGWNLPPGSRFVEYARPEGIDDIAPAPFRPRRPRDLPTVARYAIVSPVLPRLTEVLSVGERFRRALMSRSDAAPVFSGKDTEGNPLEAHRHAFFLPEGNGPHGRITHLTVYAEAGFDEEARRALDTLAKVWGRGGHDLKAVLLGVGAPEEFVGADRRSGDCELLFRSRLWVSRTPFVATRHAKTRANGEPKTDGSGLQIGSPEHDLRRLLRENGFPEPERVEPVATTDLGKSVRWLEFRTFRKRGSGRRAKHPGAGFRIEFPVEVPGPIALGYGAHYGLGVFLPEP